MKSAIAAFALACAVAAPAAGAATRIDTDAFTISYVDGPAPERWSIGLRAASPAGATISLDTLNDDLGPDFGAHDLFGNGTSNGNFHASVLRIDVRDGYRVTNLTLSGVAHGELAPGELAGNAGAAHNEASLSWALWADGEYVTAPVVRYVDVGGDVPFAAAAGALPSGGSFYLGLLGAVDAYAEAAFDGGGYRASYALAALRDVALTVEVAPVPEPGTYAMLLGGLALLGVAGHKRRK